MGKREKLAQHMKASFIISQEVAINQTRVRPIMFLK